MQATSKGREVIKFFAALILALTFIFIFTSDPFLPGGSISSGESIGEHGGMTIPG